MHVAVIGTGIVGVCTAAWLQREGHAVTFVDPLPPGEACSSGNAGSLSPSACLPVGMPGMWKKVPRWLLDPLGPLVVRPGYLPAVLPWLAGLLRHSSRAEVTRIAGALRSLLEPIFASYGPIVAHAGAEALVRRSGCLYVYSSRETAAQWAWGMELRRSLGVELRNVEREELEQLEPDLAGRFRFGILAPENGSTPDPSALVKALHARAMADGARHVSARATGFVHAPGGDRIDAVKLDRRGTGGIGGDRIGDDRIGDGRIGGDRLGGGRIGGDRLGGDRGSAASSSTNGTGDDRLGGGPDDRGVRGDVLACDAAVVAAGAWSAPLARALGDRVPLETQRGYHVTVASSNLRLRHTVMASEHNLMVNPMAMGLRLAGTVEFAGLDAPPSWPRADALLAQGLHLFPHLDATSTTRWMGHRPCLPDSLPVIGRSRRAANAWYAFGHGHMGMCMGATTGREIARRLGGGAGEVDLDPFRPDRFRAFRPF